jgi:hypothetical protein
MNTLEELNSYGNETIEYTDSRAANVTFTSVESLDYFLIINESTLHSVPVGIEIDEIINYASSLPTYTINLTDLTNATATWPTLPSYVTVENTTAGIYIVRGMRSQNDWDIVKSPSIAMPNSFFGEWSYSPTITYVYQSVLQTVNWLVTLEVLESNSLGDTVDFVYNISSSQVIADNPLIIEIGTLNPTYTITVTPAAVSSVSTMSSAGTGGTSNFNNSTKVLTIVGTKTQVNSHLSSITFTATAVENDFNMTYQATSSAGGTDTKVQFFRCASILFLGVVRTPAVYYTEDIPLTVTGGPLITDTAFDGSGTYTYTVTPSSSSAVLTLSATGTGGTTSFNSGTKVLTITGTREQVNSYIDFITLTPAVDYVLNFSLSYRVVTPRGSSATSTKTQDVLIGAQDNEIVNISVNRNYWSNTDNFPFGTTNYKTPQAQIGASYSRSSTPTLANASPIGQWDDLIPKYGTACLGINQNAFDSIDDIVQIIPASQISLTSYTIEMWYLQSVGNVSPGLPDLAAGVLFDSQTTSTGPTDISTNGMAIVLATQSSPTRAQIVIYENGNRVAYIDNILNQDKAWHHIAVSKSGSTVRIFNNGINIGSYTSSNTLTLRNTDGWIMGKGRSRVATNLDGTGPGPLTAQQFFGFIDDFRISNSGIYTSNFTPSAAGRTPNSTFYFAFDGSNGQWPPAAPTGPSGAPATLAQVIPQITDNDITNPNYTLQLTCASNFGRFSIDGITYTNNFSFTGTRAQCNTAFANIRFQSIGSGTGTVTYTQRKNGVIQLTQSITFIGAIGTAV